MAATKVRRELMTSHVHATYQDGSKDEFNLGGAYTEKRARNVIERETGKSVQEVTIDYSVDEYEMSIEDFMKYGTRRTK